MKIAFRLILGIACICTCVLITNVFAGGSTALLSAKGNQDAIVLTDASDNAVIHGLTQGSPMHRSTSEKSLIDHEATISRTYGDSKILRKGSETWVALRKGDLIRIGDQIRTGDNSYIEIYYDDFYLNTARIAENTFVEFQAIEPTRIHITSGSVYNVLDGLPKHSSYQVSTPTSVAGVRGTRFLRTFDPATRTDGLFVSHGLVAVSLVEDNHGSIDPKKVIFVQEGYGLKLDPSIKSIQNAAPQPLNSRHKQTLNSLREQMNKHLTEYAGVSTVTKGQSNWQQVKNQFSANARIGQSIPWPGLAQSNGEAFVRPENLYLGEHPGNLKKPDDENKENVKSQDHSRMIVPVRRAR